MRGRLLVSIPVAILLAGLPAEVLPIHATPGVVDLLGWTPVDRDLVWSPAIPVRGYNLYRGSLDLLQLGDYGECLQGGIQGTSAEVPEDPAPGQGFFYLVGGIDETGHGPLGWSSGGGPRIPSLWCTPNRRYFELAPDSAPDGLPSREPLRNPGVREWNGSREATGVVLHSGEFTLFAEDPVGGRPKDGPDEWGRWYRVLDPFVPGSRLGLYGAPWLLHHFLSDEGLTVEEDSDEEEIPPFVLDFTPKIMPVHPPYVLPESEPSDLWGFEEEYLDRMDRDAEEIQRALAGAGSGGTVILGPGTFHFPPPPSPSGFSGTFPGRSRTDDASGGGASSEPSERREVQKKKSGSGFVVPSETKSRVKKKRMSSSGSLVDSLSNADLHKMIRKALAKAARAALDQIRQIGRTYRSQIRYDGPMGHGWDFEANSRLEPLGSNVVWYDGAGRRFVFYRIDPVRFTSPMGLYAKLFEESGGFFLREPDGTLRRYHSFDGSNLQGALESVEDLHGNMMAFLYDHQGLLTTIVDDLGRATTLGYDSLGRITSIVDFAGREVIYGYSPEGDLVSVRSPIVTGTPNGNDFPSGKTTQYEYSSGFADDRLNHDLLSVISPNESGSGTPFLQNTYETDPNLFALDRVTTQEIGGIGSSGVPAGGLLTYAYLPLNLGADPLLMDVPRRRVLVTDRNGNETEFLVNAAGNVLSAVERTNRNLRPGEPDYLTEYAYNADGEITDIVLPEGNSALLTYDRPGLDRYREGDLLEVRLVADTTASGGRGDGRGGEMEDVVWTFSHEPISRGLASAVEARGNDPTYTPDNGGVTSPGRYRTSWTYDYQEGDPNTNGIAALAARFDIDISGVPFNLGDLNGDGLTSQAGGDPVLVEQPTVNLDPASNQAVINGDTTQEIVTQVTYNGHGQITSVLDAEGNRHELEYHPETDPDGDGVPTPAPPDGRPLDPSTGGYLSTITLDTLSSPGRNNGTNPTPVSLEVDFEYDAAGNLLSLVNGRGVRTTWIYNQLDQVVEVRRASATASSPGPHGDPATGRGETGLAPLGHRLRFEYDADDNLVRRQIEDVGATRGVGSWVETDHGYDILDNEISREREATASTTLLTQIEYDANENPIRVTYPVGNTDDYAWDERDLLLSVTRGATGPRGGAPSTRGFDYDGNGDLTRLTDAKGGLVDFLYDGVDRLARVVDQVGNTSDRYYDPAGNLVRLLHRGPVSGPTPPDRLGTANVDLADAAYLYDEMNRLFGIDRQLFVPAGASPMRPPSLSEGPLVPGDGAVNHRLEHDRLSRWTFSVEDSGATSRLDFDGICRATEGVNAAGDNINWNYGGTHTINEAVETEPPSAPGPPPEVFLTTFFYDALDRLTTVVDNVGQTWRLEYDSLDAVTARTDPRGPAGGMIERRSPAYAGTFVAVNGHGNLTRYEYDGLGRRIVTEHVLTATGEGDGTTSPAPDTSNPSNPDGLITVTTAWDDDSLVLSRQDDGGNGTGYTYDNLNRLISVTADDGTLEQYGYDLEDNPVSIIRADGSVIARAHDAAHRLTGVSVSRAAGIEGTTAQSYEYDGLSRLTMATDDNDPANGADDATVERIYDSLGRLFEDNQGMSDGLPVRSTGYGLAAADLVTEIVYPSDRLLSYAYDAADRLVSVTDPNRPESAGYEYFGEARLHTLSYGNGVRATMLDDTGTLDIGYDGARRIALLRHLDPNAVLLAGFEYRHDRAGNRRSHRRLHDVDPNTNAMGEGYAHDSAGRLVSFEEAFLDPNHEVAGPIADAQSWTLDGQGNWDEFTRNGVAYNDTPNNNNEYDEPQSGGVRVDDGIADDFADPLGTPGADGLNLAHDLNGNQTFDGIHQLFYDAFGRLVRAVRVSDGQQVASYTYDGLDRRIRREVTNSGPLDETRRYYYAGAGVIEERDGADVLMRQVVFGGGAGGRLWQVLGDGTAQYFLHDALGSIVALADGAGPAVMERVTYDAYGKPTFEDPTNLPLVDPNGLFLARSGFGNENLLAGMRYDPELGARTAAVNTDRGGLYQTLYRYYSPLQGRFISRDPLGLWGDPIGMGNGYAYAGSDPVNLTDPLGLGGYIKIPGVTGEVEKGDRGWIEVSSVQQGVGRSLSGGSGRARGRADAPPRRSSGSWLHRIWERYKRYLESILRY